MLGQRPRLRRTLDGVTGELPRAWTSRAWLLLVVLLVGGLLSAVVGSAAGLTRAVARFVDPVEHACLTHPRWDGSRRALRGLWCGEHQTEDALYHLDLERAALGRRTAHLLELEPDLSDRYGYQPRMTPWRDQGFRVSRVQAVYDAMTPEEQALVDAFVHAPPWYDGPGLWDPLTWDDVVSEGPASLSGRTFDHLLQPPAAPWPMPDDHPSAIEAERRTHAELLAARPLFDALFDAADAHQLALHEQVEPEARAWKAQVVQVRAVSWWAMLVGAALALVLLLPGGILVGQALFGRRIRVRAGPAAVELGRRSIPWEAVAAVEVEAHQVVVRLGTGATVRSPRLAMHPTVAAELREVVDERLRAFDDDDPHGRRERARLEQLRQR